MKLIDNDMLIIFSHYYYWPISFAGGMPLATGSSINVATHATSSFIDVATHATISFIDVATLTNNKKNYLFFLITSPVLCFDVIGVRCDKVFGRPSRR